jgi:hypothetical protein
VIQNVKFKEPSVTILVGFYIPDINFGTDKPLAPLTNIAGFQELLNRARDIFIPQLSGPGRSNVTSIDSESIGRVADALFHL